ncbi:MAG: hypothetical protein LW823_05395 [Rickettsiales bacterium]|nr:hypothetical protein [Rickettsiales bacterium]
MRLPFKVFYILGCAWLVIVGSTHWFVTSHAGDTWRGATLLAMAGGTAERPYVYRWLVPQTLRVIDQVTPSDIRNRVNTELANWRDQLQQQELFPPRLAKALSDEESLYMRASWLGVIIVSLALFTFSMHRLAIYLWPAVTLAAPVLVFTSWALVLALPAPVLYLYDPPALALSAICLAMLAAKRWAGFTFVFLLASLNKESSLMLWLILAWLSIRFPKEYLSWPRLWSLALLWLIIRIMALYIFYDNPGIILETQYQSYYSDHPNALLTILTCCGLLLWSARRMNELLKASTGVLTIMAIAYLLFGKPGELRVFYDVVPMMSIFLVQAVRNIITHLRVKVRA